MPAFMKAFFEDTSIFHTVIMQCYHQKTFAHALPAGWRFFKDSKSIKNTTGYYGQVWINEKTKKLLFVSSGTKTDFYNMENSKAANLFGAINFAMDLVNDFKIYMLQTPYQYEYGVKKFIDSIMSDTSIDTQKFDIYCTGHSMGATLACLASVYLYHFPLLTER